MAQVIVERAERVDERGSASDSGGSGSDSEDEGEVLERAVSASISKQNFPARWLRSVTLKSLQGPRMHQILVYMMSLQAPERY